MSKVKLLCMSGSLRELSYNSALLHAYKALAPQSVEVTLFGRMGELPLFNPDLEETRIAAVSGLKDEIAWADGLIIASPEYAHGITGVLKNALDWIVSDENFPYMPVALLNTSPRAAHAQASLREVINTMSGNIIEKASLTVPLLSSELDADGIICHPDISGAILRSIDNFVEAIMSQNKSAGDFAEKYVTE